MLSQSWNIRLTLLAAVLFLALIGVREVIGQTPSPDEKKAQELERLKNQPDVVDPTTVAEQRQFYQQSMETVRENYVKWLEEFNASGVNPRTLQLGEIAALYEPGPQSMDEAVNVADLVVSGVANGVAYRAAPGLSFGADSFVTFAIETVIKGDLSGDSDIQVVSVGGPAPRGDSRAPSDAALTYLPISPPLFEGDEAVLLLVESGRYPGLYEPIGWVGVNRIVDGRIVANLFDGEDVSSLQGTPIRGSLHGLSRDELEQQLTDAVMRN